ncbi:MAG: hypothetical protein ACLTW9_04300 [Enterocloster sp.]
MWSGVFGGLNHGPIRCNRRYSKKMLGFGDCTDEEDTLKEEMNLSG